MIVKKREREIPVSFIFPLIHVVVVLVKCFLLSTIGWPTDSNVHMKKEEKKSTALASFVSSLGLLRRHNPTL